VAPKNPTKGTYNRELSHGAMKLGDERRDLHDVQYQYFNVQQRRFWTGWRRKKIKKVKGKDEAGCSIHLNLQSTNSGNFFCFTMESQCPIPGGKRGNAVVLILL
jgi:hypothetical protein